MKSIFIFENLNLKSISVNAYVLFIVSGGTWIHSRGIEGDCERHWHEQDDASHKRPIASTDAHSQEQTRKSSGKLYRFSGKDRRSGRRVYIRQRMDAHLL